MFIIINNPNVAGCTYQSLMNYIISNTGVFMDYKVIIMAMGLLASGGGAFAIYADNGELRGKVEVLQYKVDASTKSLADLTEQYYKAQCD